MTENGITDTSQQRRDENTHASNGRAVVSHYISQHSEGGFDVVLMDCQMPIRGGYEAPRQIRSWEKRQQSRRTPMRAWVCVWRIEPVSCSRRANYCPAA